MPITSPTRRPDNPRVLQSPGYDGRGMTGFTNFLGNGSMDNSAFFPPESLTIKAFFV
jgi:hypothetical protein